MPPVSARTAMKKVDLWGSGSSNRFDRPRLWTCGNALVYLFIHLSSLHNDRAPQCWHPWAAIVPLGQSGQWRQGLIMSAIRTTLTCFGWRCCFVADQLWFMTRIREEQEDCIFNTHVLVCELTQFSWFLQTSAMIFAIFVVIFYCS